MLLYEGTRYQRPPPPMFHHRRRPPFSVATNALISCDSLVKVITKVNLAEIVMMEAVAASCATHSAIPSRCDSS